MYACCGQQKKNFEENLGCKKSSYFFPQCRSSWFSGTFHVWRKPTSSAKGKTHQRLSSQAKIKQTPSHPIKIRHNYGELLLPGLDISLVVKFVTHFLKTGTQNSLSYVITEAGTSFWWNFSHFWTICSHFWWHFVHFLRRRLKSHKLEKKSDFLLP